MEKFTVEDLFGEHISGKFKETFRKINNKFAALAAGKDQRLISPEYGPYEFDKPVIGDDGSIYYPDEMKQVTADKSGDVIGYQPEKKLHNINNRRFRMPAKGIPDVGEMTSTEDKMPGVVSEPKFSVPNRSLKDISQM